MQRSAANQESAASAPQGVAEIAGCINGAAVVLLLTACLSIYGAVTFQSEGPQVSWVGGCMGQKAAAPDWSAEGGIWKKLKHPQHAQAVERHGDPPNQWSTCHLPTRPLSPAPHPLLSTQVGIKTLSGRSIPRDPLQSAEGWNKFAAGFAVGGLSGAAWGYIMTQVRTRCAPRTLPAPPGGGAGACAIILAHAAASQTCALLGGSPWLLD